MARIYRLAGKKNEDSSSLYLSLWSAQTDLSANIQIRVFEDGWYRVFAIWPDDIDSNYDEIEKYVSQVSLHNYDYGRLKFSRDEKCIFYVSDVYINDISELTDEILDKTITGTALYIAEYYGPDIAKIVGTKTTE
jgi:hypothetical protein